MCYKTRPPCAMELTVAAQGWQSRRRLQIHPSHVPCLQFALRFGTAVQQGRCILARSANIEDHQPVVYEIKHALGKIVIRNLEESDVDSAAVLLCRSFAGREWQSLEDVKSYLHMACVLFPSSVVLVAKLFQENDPGHAPEIGSRILAVADLTLSPRLLPKVVPKQFMAVPEGSVYLSNMCVDPKVRGCGVGRCMLEACEKAVRDSGRLDRISLHADTEVAPFYQSNGYAEVRRRGVLSVLKSGPVVMTKMVPIK